MLEVKNLTKSFHSSGEDVRAVSNASFSLKPGVCAAIVGPSGSGKSTLMALLGALEAPSSGQITIDGIELADASPKQLVTYRQQLIGFVFQSYNLVPNLTARENVMLPMEFIGIRRGARRARADELLEQVGLNGGKRNRRPSRLSGGEQQRVAIARALANKPKLILADEPTGNLDSKTSATIFSLLRRLAREEGTTVVIVTHDLALAERADERFVMEDGRLAQAA